MTVANKLFGSKRWKQVVKHVDTTLELRDQLLQLCFGVLHSSGWYDDPSDKIRTMSNMELATICYVDERLAYMEHWPIYVANTKDPDCIIGIEQAYDIVLLYDDDKAIRCIGTIDGLVVKMPDGNYVLDENKTASRLDTGWRASFDLSHQITGYCAACSIVFGFNVVRSRVTGVKIKPTSNGEDVYPLEPSHRNDMMFQQWARWVRSQSDLYERFENDWENADRFTHSCNRYFRPCALLSFCCDDPEGRREQWDQMAVAEPTPSERAIMEIGV